MINSYRAWGGLVLIAAMAACSGGKPPRTPAPSPLRQIWTVNVDGGICQAYAHCGALEPGEECRHTGGDTGTVQLVEVPCLTERPDVRQWDIGQLASDGSCVILGAKCGANLAPCTPPSSPMSCPADTAASTPPAVTEEPSDVAATAQGNLDKGQAALAAKDTKRAREYFAYTARRFPLSRLVHDAELGLVDADALDAGTGALGAQAAITSHCAFIGHHPWHPRVVSGDVACRLERLQNRPCVAGDRAAERSCAPVTSPTADAELAKAREAATNDPAAARSHLEKVIAQAPRSRQAHEAELALIELDLTGVAVTDDTTTAPLCAYIEHHPFEPAVTAGDVACRVNTLQGQECTASQVVPTQYCRLAYCEDPHGEGRKRPECKVP